MIIEDRRMEMQGNINTTMQNIFLENRNKLNITGVKDVLSFDDEVIIMETELGLLTVKGENLKINKLSIDSSEVIVDGEINNLNYSQQGKKEQEQSIFSKIFK